MKVTKSCILAVSLLLVCLAFQQATAACHEKCRRLCYDTKGGDECLRDCGCDPHFEHSSHTEGDVRHHSARDDHYDRDHGHHHSDYENYTAPKTQHEHHDTHGHGVHDRNDEIGRHVHKNISRDSHKDDKEDARSDVDREVERHVHSGSDDDDVSKKAHHVDHDDIRRKEKEIEHEKKKNEHKKRKAEHQEENIRRKEEKAQHDKEKVEKHIDEEEKEARRIKEEAAERSQQAEDRAKKAAKRLERAKDKARDAQEEVERLEKEEREAERIAREERQRAEAAKEKEKEAHKEKEKLVTFLETEKAIQKDDKELLQAADLAEEAGLFLELDEGSPSSVLSKYTMKAALNGKPETGSNAAIDPQDQNPAAAGGNDNNIPVESQPRGVCDTACKEKCYAHTSTRDFINCLKECNCLKRVSPVTNAVEEKPEEIKREKGYGLIIVFMMILGVIFAGAYYMKDKRFYRVDEAARRHKNEDLYQGLDNYQRLR